MRSDMLKVSAGLVALLLATAGMAQTPASRPALTETMSLDQIHQALIAHPPNWANGRARHRIFSSLDKHVTVRVRSNRRIPLTPEEHRTLKPLIGFYRKRMDLGLDKLARTRVTSGVHVFKFYSSSFVFRSSAGTLLLDFAQGPVLTEKGHPEDEDTLKTGFYWTPEQRARLAEQVDVAMITHRHFDHCDYSLVRSLLARGKPVIAPDQVRKKWKGRLSGITMPAYGKVQKIGPVEILTKLGWQYGTNRTDADGKHRAYPDIERPERNSETVIYLFRMGGIVFLHAGENHLPYDEFLAGAARRGWKVNVCRSPGQWQGAWSTRKVLRNFLTLTGHEYEMTHPGGGNRLAYQLTGGSLKQYHARSRLTLTWGEDMLLDPESMKWTR